MIIPTRVWYCNCEIRNVGMAYWIAVGSILDVEPAQRGLNVAEHLKKVVSPLFLLSHLLQSLVSGRVGCVEDNHQIDPD